MDELRGRVAVVTGAASGIGLALAKQFAANGLRVVMTDVDEDRLSEAAAAVEGEVAAIAGDVARYDDVEKVAAHTFERFGAVHVLCNNAGVTRPGAAWELSGDEWSWLLSVNLGGVVNGVRAFVPRMLDSGEPGHVVNTASIGGLLPYAGLGAYSAAKYGVVGLSETLLLDLRAAAAPIGVSVLCPGPIDTDFRTHSRRLHPDGAVPAESYDAPAAARIPASDVAALVVAAIRDDRFWILTHPAYRELIERRARGIVETDEVVAGDLR
jgi:NAD(P)-dependent dehydrogenase (short-subunit alcohol dehydrogenase family)